MAGISSRFTKASCGVVTSGWSRLLTSDGAHVRRCMLRPMGGGGGGQSSLITTHITLGWDGSGGDSFCVARDTIDEQVVISCE